MQSMTVTGRRGGECGARRMFKGILASAGALAIVLSSASSAGAQAGCPQVVDDDAFPGASQLKKLVNKNAGFGLRFPASASNDEQIAWLSRQARKIDGMKIRNDHYSLPAWLPTAEAKDSTDAHPRLDLARAGGLTVDAKGAGKIPVAGAIPFSKPAPKGGPKGDLVYLPPDVPITPENAAGKVVIRDFVPASIPYSVFQALGLYIGPDSSSRAGDYTRPYLTGGGHEDLLAASAAGVAGLIVDMDIPRKQARGYSDPHAGTFYGAPAVFVGNEQAAQLKRLAEQNVSASVTVKAKIDRSAKTRTLIASLPGQSPQRMILSTNTDGAGWVQDNGPAGMLALARYYGKLPLECRPRTLELEFGAAHQTLIHDGTNRYAAEMDRNYDKGTVSFAFGLEHLGTRELVPVADDDGSGQHLEFTGKAEPWLWAVGPSQTLRDAIVGIAQRRNLPDTAVLRGASAPTPTVPSICSFGGLGNAFHQRLIPTTAIISGPWSLYAQSFGREAINMNLLRGQLLAAGDTLLALDGLPQADIAGDYTNLREQRAQGAATCPNETYPQTAPGPGA